MKGLPCEWELIREDGVCEGIVGVSCSRRGEGVSRAPAPTGDTLAVSETAKSRPGQLVIPVIPGYRLNSPPMDVYRIVINPHTGELFN